MTLILISRNQVNNYDLRQSRQLPRVPESQESCEDQQNREESEYQTFSEPETPPPAYEELYFGKNEY